nr:uncharacterized protein LOC129262464 isoform X2 [Lytechinus pictus]
MSAQNTSEIQHARIDPGTVPGHVTATHNNNNNSLDKDTSHQDSNTGNTAPCHQIKKDTMESCVGLQLQFDHSHPAHGDGPVQVSLADVDAVVNADVGTSAPNDLSLTQCQGVMVQAGGNEETNNSLLQEVDDNLLQALVNSGATEQLEMESLAHQLMNDSIEFFGSRDPATFADGYY